MLVLISYMVFSVFLRNTASMLVQFQLKIFRGIYEINYCKEFDYFYARLK